MKSKIRNLIAIVPLTIAAIATITTVVYLYSSAEPENPKPSAQPAELLETVEPTAMAPSESSKETEAKPRNATERLAYSLSAEQHNRLLTLLNEGTPKELLKIYGVGKIRAEAIQAARPFDSLADLAKVNGVGKITFASVIEHGKQLDDREAIVAIAPSSMR